MITTGQLTMGAVQIVSKDSSEVIGHAYTVANGGGQLQRWLLYRNPQNAFDVRPPPASTAGLSLEEWKSKVPGLWRPGSYYVFAQADLYRYGETHDGETWTRIPPASRLPPPSYYPAGPRQLDPDGRILDVLQGNFRGLAFSVLGLSNPNSVEYWMLPSAYVPAGGGATARVATGARAASSLQAFVDTANQSWAPGCTFAITGCVNYRGDKPPVQR
ncbi:hypothetical protein [Sorangium sp. So ce1078]|uniref:hypothetical protein n=1 Tax=Sorangium sp. So ce1078 TaxID=3133329 RepID=UPI003F5E490D